MSRNNHKELNKITLVGWVDQALEQSLTKKISSLDLRPHVYDLLIPRQWTSRLNLSQIYIIKLVNDQGSENNTKNDELD